MGLLLLGDLPLPKCGRCRYVIRQPLHIIWASKDVRDENYTVIDKLESVAAALAGQLPLRPVWRPLLACVVVH